LGAGAARACRSRSKRSMRKGRRSHLVRVKVRVKVRVS
jgi:hypothetical protein